MPTSSPNTRKIDVEMVKHVAYLVRLGISEAEAQEFSRQFSSIIDYFNMLGEVETEAVPPAAAAHGAENRMRADEVRPSMPREEFLANVPRREGGYVRVPLVLGDE
jgi:aspartyl-tRNA(Asn)/glutamyl-tRNA(Gln) amidotransferase subunit C